jgi:hypothetical protein
MADSTERVSRGLKIFFETYFNKLMGGKQGIDRFLFPIANNDLSANVAMDELQFTPHAIAFRDKDQQSQVLPYSPGTGMTYAVPHASAKTPVTEKLRDAVIAGNEATASFASNNGRLMEQILQQHTTCHAITAWKAAIDVMRTSIFGAKGLKGESIGLEIAQTRDASLTTTYDFTAAGATMDKALKAMYDAARAQNMPMSNIVVIFGKKWLAQFENDTAVQKFLEANTSNILLTQQMAPAELNNTYGLFNTARYRARGVVAPMFICAFEADKPFYQYKGATAEEFFPEGEAIMFSLSTPRIRVNRGVDLYNDNKQIVRAVADTLYDDFTQDDPIGYFVRSHSRYALLQSDPNTVVRCTGTFAGDSE